MGTEIAIPRCTIAGVRIKSGDNAAVVLSVVLPLDRNYGKLAQTLATFIEMEATLKLTVAVTEIQPELS
jgi:hypothetical protein